MLSRLILLCLFATGFGCASTPDAAASLRVMTWNIHHGRGTDGKIDLERIAAVIRAADVQLVALQEVDVCTERVGGRDLATELARLCGMTAVFGKNIDFRGGDYGNAVLTSLPEVRHSNLHYRMLREGEQRGLLQVIVQLEGQAIGFFNTHIDYRPDDSERLSNLGEIHAIAQQHAGMPIILCGDFNDTPGSRTHSAALEVFRDGWAEVGAGEGHTYPANAAKKRIDYVFTNKGAGFSPLAAKVLQSDASDHLPLVLEFSLRRAWQ